MADVTKEEILSVIEKIKNQRKYYEPPFHHEINEWETHHCYGVVQGFDEAIDYLDELLKR